MEDIGKYLGLITSSYRDKPNFLGVVSSALQPFVDSENQIAGIVPGYDLDSASGSQLDVVGNWVGIARSLKIPLVGVYFAFNTPGLGINQGLWQGPYDPGTGLTNLPDDEYRILLRSKIANNQWDGTSTQAYEIYNAFFNLSGNGFFIQEFGGMKIAIGAYGPPLAPVPLALLTQGYLDIKPAGVQISNYLSPSVAALRNRLTNTATLSPGWLTNNSPNFTLDGTLAPDGSTTAIKFVSTGFGDGRFVPINLTSGTTYTYSCYFKAGGSGSLWLGDDLNGSVVNVSTLGLANIGNGVGTVSPLVGGWYRFSVVFTTTTALSSILYSTSAGTFYIWGPQLELGTTVTDYQPVLEMNGNQMFSFNMNDANFGGFNNSAWALGG